MVGVFSEKWLFDNIRFKFKLQDLLVEIETLRISYPREDSPAHWNDGYEFHIITNGTAKYYINEYGVFTLEKGDMLLIPPKTIHSEKVYNNCEGIILGFTITFEKNFSDLNKQQVLNYLSKCYFSKDSNNLRSMFTQLENELHEKRKFCLVFAQNIIANIIIELYRKICNDIDERDDVLPKKTPHEDQSYIISDYFSGLSRSNKTDFSLKELADIMFMSERQLSRYLLRHYNKTFVNLLNDTKIEYIKYLLTNSDLTIEEIADKCCWSIKYLYKCFKAKTGFTPNKYLSGHNTSKNKF